MIRRYLLKRAADRAAKAYQDYLDMPAGLGWSVHVASALQRKAYRSASLHAEALAQREAA